MKPQSFILQNMVDYLKDYRERKIPKEMTSYYNGFSEAIEQIEQTIYANENIKS